MNFKDTNLAPNWPQRRLQKGPSNLKCSFIATQFFDDPPDDDVMPPADLVKIFKSTMPRYKDNLIYSQIRLMVPRRD